MKRSATPVRFHADLLLSPCEISCTRSLSQSRCPGSFVVYCEDSCPSVPPLCDCRSALMPLRIVFTICMRANGAQAWSLRRNQMLACSLCCLYSCCFLPFVNIEIVFLCAFAIALDFSVHCDLNRTVSVSFTQLY